MPRDIHHHRRWPESGVGRRRRVVIANRRPGGLWWRVPLAVILWLAFAVPVAAAGVAYSILSGYLDDVPRAPDLVAWEQTLPRSSRIVARDGTVLATLPFRDGEVVGHRFYTPIEEIPPLVIQAFVAAEDVRFAGHRGVDLRAVLRAARANYEAGRVVEGASTITQQLARGLLPDELGTERSLRRKVREAMVAFRLERRYDKRRILEAYLNFVFLGGGSYGVRAAARAYWDAELEDLDIAEAALLAGMAQAPGRTNPLSSPRAARERRDEVIRRMHRAGFITADERDRALARGLDLSPPEPRYGELAPWHTEAVRRRIEERYPEAYRRGGLEVVSTADVPLSLGAEALTRGVLEDRWPEHTPQIGALAWDHRTGYVELTIGGQSWSQSVFDRATQACRQPGSAFKPIVYAAAIESNAITPGTPLRDAPIAEYDWDLDVHWKPKNSGRQFRGVALAADALASSLNAPAVDVFDRAGAKAVTSLALRLGITTELAEVRPLALGSSCVIPIELARAYAILARGGRDVEPVFATRVSARGQILEDLSSYLDPFLAPQRRLDAVAASAAAEPEPVIDAATAFLMRDMLRGVVERGTGTRARRLPVPVAGKTGTTNDNTDAWFVGFSPRVVAAVWLGYDDPRRPLGRGHDGGRAALPLWIELMRAAEGQRRGGSVVGEPPPGVVSARVDRETGLLASPGAGGGIELFFKSGSQPTEEAGRSRSVPSDVHRATSEF